MTRRRGGVAIEFAVVLPVLLVIIAGVLEWGQIVVREVAVTQIARDAALAGARTELTEDPAAVAIARATAALTEAGFTGGGAEVATVDIDGDAGLAVTVHAPYRRTIPLVPAPTTLTCTVTARLEDQ